MAITELRATAEALVADGKGILAADETVPTVTKRLQARHIESTADTRRAYREMLFTTPGVGEFISGVIMQDETIHQTSSSGERLAERLTAAKIIPGIKVDEGVVDLAGSPGESVTQGLDGLGDRLRQYRQLGARFAKWRAIFAVTEAQPSRMCVLVNANALARYAAVCQHAGLVPIVEPEVLMDGAHTIERCEKVTGEVLHAVFDALFDQGVVLDEMLLKPNMIVSGSTCTRRASLTEVAEATLRCLRRHAPAAVPGIVFLSGGQDSVTATRHLNAINQLATLRPWKLTFSFGRALQDEAMAAWQGRKENIEAGQEAFSRRARCNSAAAVGRYVAEMETAREMATSRRG
jgi:fructose-bisphosphate aldolase class I